MKIIRFKDIEAVFGIKDDDPFGRALWPIYQSAASLSQSYTPMINGKVRCLVAYAIDQDPYFRLARSYCDSANAKAGYEVYLKPCGIMSRFLPALEGDSKMSTTGYGPNPGVSKAIFLSDNPKDIHEKIIKYAFSGGQDTKQKHRELGGNTDIDIPFQWLRHFMEDDDELERIRLAYSKGEMLTFELKKICANVITKLVLEHQERCKMVTPDIIKRFYSANGKGI
jgi:tryptophanyl-tRNA synthetase